MQSVYLLCGVSGSGKTWVCRQLQGKMDYIEHDKHTRADLLGSIMRSSRISTKPLIVDCPFAERSLKDELEKWGLKVIPVFIVETPDVCAQRYRNREGKEIQKSAYTRASTIVDRAKEWGAEYGTSDQIFKLLNAI